MRLLEASCTVEASFFDLQSFMDLLVAFGAGNVQILDAPNAFCLLNKHARFENAVLLPFFSLTQKPLPHLGL